MEGRLRHAIAAIPFTRITLVWRRCTKRLQKFVYRAKPNGIADGRLWLALLVRGARRCRRVFRRGNSHRLSIPQPMPASLFWSVTVYDPEYSFRNPHRPGPGRTALLDTRGGPALPLERQLHLQEADHRQVKPIASGVPTTDFPLGKTARTDPIALVSWTTRWERRRAQPSNRPTRIYRYRLTEGLHGSAS